MECRASARPPIVGRLVLWRSGPKLARHRLEWLVEAFEETPPTAWFRCGWRVMWSSA